MDHWENDISSSSDEADDWIPAPEHEDAELAFDIIQGAVSSWYPPANPGDFVCPYVADQDGIPSWEASLSLVEMVNGVRCWRRTMLALDNSGIGPDNFAEHAWVWEDRLRFRHRTAHL
jgi:hypothetical protein